MPKEPETEVSRHGDARPTGAEPGAAKRLLGCKLCRAVTFSVFLLVLAVESVILVPSARNFEANELERLEAHARSAVRAAIGREDRERPELLVRRVRALVEHPPLLGLAIRDAGGRSLAAAGEVPGVPALSFGFPAEDGVVLRARSRDGRHYDFAWRAALHGEPAIVLARLDSSHIRGELRAFVLRIAGLVLSIVAVVTSGTMFVVYRGVLHPILRLRTRMVAAAADPDSADRYRIGERPGNELGELFAAHDTMLERVAESKRADRLRAEERARYLSRHDALTGLPDRRFFLEQLEHAAVQGRGLEVMVLDLGGFRAVNDAFGQAAGDRVLGAVAGRLASALERDAFVARLEGDEFGVSRTGVRGALDSARHAERLIARITEPIEVAGGEVRLKCRIGITWAPAARGGALARLHEAELALGRIRREPRSGYQFFSPEMAEEARERQEIERELRAAIGSGAFHLVYQPKVAIAPGERGEIVACEALIRWTHPARGPVSPARFIPIAESTGLIDPIGEWALGEACAQLVRWAAQGLRAPRTAKRSAKRSSRSATASASA